MEIKKAHWTSDDNSFAMSMELTKVDKENRLVSGWASLDNPDLQGDLVLAEASQRAFEKFRGNIREMHKNEAVGRMVAYKPDSYYDPETGQMYKGIYVTAYVSKGAPLTWEKVIDGTLSAFSIKGPIKDSEMDFSKGDKPLRIVKDYELEELSLVDSGGNQLANVVSIQKVNGEVKVTGMIADTDFKNVFWCGHEQVAKISDLETETCLEGHVMEKAGVTEDDSRADAEKIKSVLDNYLVKGNSKQDETPVNKEGGVDVADTKKNEDAPIAGTAVPAEVDAEEQGKPETEVAASVENAADVEEVESDEEVEKAADVEEVDADADLEKALGDLEAKIQDGVTKNESAIAELMKSIDEKFEKRDNEIESKLDDLAQKQDGLSKSLEGLQESLEKMVKSVGSLESETALKKSGDLGGSQEDGTLEKSSGSGVWSGAFLN